ncbi:hypothetical protein IWZ03DRAFT_414534 [Phyllosticta citriasiana]|uniref:Uncharacterized protein n=1 Tax=Phyllosticta citriasiana TaxID=595635 RepID=A0ABR1KMI5_9PEZI
MASNTCSFYTHTGSVTAYSTVPALRFLHGYLSALDSNNLAAFSPKTFFSDAALYHAADGTTYRSDQEIWDATKTRFEDMEFMHHQTCVTRVFGPDVKRLRCGEKHVINSQTMMLCRLKGWEEERMLEIPRVFEFVIGKVEDAPLSPLPRNDEEEDAGEDAENAGDDAPQQREETAEPTALDEKRGHQGLQIYEARVWWDSGALARAIEEKNKEEQKRRFREILTLNNGFLGQGRR